MLGKGKETSADIPPLFWYTSRSLVNLGHTKPVEHIRRAKDLESHILYHIESATTDLGLLCD